jgi:mRNA interferase RelE/StbE
VNYIVVFKPSAQKQLSKLDKTTQSRIGKKLLYYLEQKDTLSYAVKMADSNLDGEYRFRIGDYRIVFDVHGQKLVVLKIQHRRNVYKNK